MDKGGCRPIWAFDKVHIILFEEFEKDPVAVVNGVLDFLELPDDVDLGMVKRRIRAAR